MVTQTIPCITGAGIAGLSRYLGESVEEFCAFGSGKQGDGQNHCAHFVGHMPSLQAGGVCNEFLEWSLPL